MADVRVKRENAPPDVAKLLDALDAHRVRYVVIRSVAAKLYGVEVEPGDLDIAPALDQENLDQLAQVLLAIEAVLPETKEVGQWEPQPDGEKKWISRKATQEDLRSRAEWVPDPADVSTLDHLFCTCYGNLDVVPDLSGGYETLIRRAKRIKAYGREILAAHVDELLAALTVPRRKKDVLRARQLRDLQRLQNE